MFNVADKVLLNPIPGHGRDELFTLHEVDVLHDFRWNVSPPLIEELATHSNLIESLTYFHGPEAKKFRVGERTVKLRGATVAPNFFELLRLRPWAGRTFLSNEGNRESEPSVLISHGLWQQYLGGDLQVVGRSIELDGKAHTVVGIMPSNVQFPFGSGYSQFWIPHVFTTEQVNSEWAARDRVWMTIGRLREGAKLPALHSALQVVARRREPSLHEPDRKWVIQAKPAWQSLSSAELQKSLWFLLAMVVTLLLIACANVGNLLLSRTLARRGEFSIRMAMGAGRLRVARQLMVESFTLAGIASVLGLILAWAGVIALEQFYLSQLPRISVIGLDWGGLGLACLVSILAGVLFGTMPAWCAGRMDLNQSLKESAQQHTGGVFQRLFHDSLVVIQVSLAVVLLAGAGLMIQSVIRLLRVEPGLRAKGLYRVYYDAIDFMNQRAYDFKGALARGVPRNLALQESWKAEVERHFTFQRVALERLQAVVGVESAAVNAGAGFSDFEIEGKPGRVWLGQSGASVLAGDYLRTIGAKLVGGRLLRREDAAPGQQGVVINEKMAAVGWPGESALGKRFHRRDPPGDWVVVGIVKNIKDWQLESEAKPVFYEPSERETKSLGSVGDYVLRSRLEADQLRESVVRAGKEMLAPLDLREFYSIQSQLKGSTAPRRVMMWLMITLGGLGLLLSALGAYAVLAYAVVRRTHEVGIRMALGAEPGQIHSLFLGHGVRLIVNGMVLGLVAAIAAARYLESLLYQVRPTDPWILAGVLLILSAATFIACWLPARRAARVDPMVALRRE